jgi:uncharacterized protein
MNGTVRLQAIIRNDALRWRLLGLVRSLHLPDCWIGAGFVRNAAWDALHGRASSPLASDVDVLLFDPGRTGAAEDRIIEAMLHRAEPSVAWSVKNQARMHLRNGDAPYASTTDAMRFWPDTATAVAVRRIGQDGCEIAAPYGLEDLFHLVIRPTPRFAGTKRPVYEQRIRTKGWLAQWPLLRDVEAMTGEGRKRDQ